MSSTAEEPHPDPQEPHPDELENRVRSLEAERLRPVPKPPRSCLRVAVDQFLHRLEAENEAAHDKGADE